MKTANTDVIVQNIPQGFSRFDSSDYLKSDEDMRGYFEACMEEDPGDGSLIRYALGAIARAKSMTQLAKDTGLAREGLYRALSPNGNPEFTTVMKVLKALDLRLTLGKPSALATA